MKTQKEIKQDYFDRVYEKAELIECACGCGEKLKSKDRYGRDKKFVNGHNGRKYEDPHQYKAEYLKRHKKELKGKQVAYMKKKKAILIEEKGGCCMHCGLKHDGTNGSLFQFHHRDPSQKEFAVSLNKMWKSWDKLRKEAEKCDLLCANCHFLHHSSEY